LALNGFHQKDHTEKEAEMIKEIPKHRGLLETEIGQWVQKDDKARGIYVRKGALIA
jgi:hypothetical protein